MEILALFIIGAISLVSVVGNIYLTIIVIKAIRKNK